MRIALINGPNLNLLGLREPEIYGRETLQDLENNARRFAQSLGIEIECYQSNNEGHLIDALQRARLRCQGIVFNPAGYTHTSVALRDAILAVGIPVIEVHLSNPHKREEFRQTMLTTGACVGQVSGMGLAGYEVAISGLAKLLKSGFGGRVAAQPGAVTAAAPAASFGDRDSRGGLDDDREARRRKRGRRGGRGRRRDGEPFDAEGREDSIEDRGTDASERPEDIEAKYAGLRGATVRRGMDVLAESDEEPAAAQAGSGSVNFNEAPEEVETAEVRSAPAAAASRSEPASDAKLTTRPEPVRRPAPLYGRWRPAQEPAGVAESEARQDRSFTPPPDSSVEADSQASAADDTVEEPTPRKGTRRGRPAKAAKESAKKPARPKKAAKRG